MKSKSNLQAGEAASRARLKSGVDVWAVPARDFGRVFVLRNRRRVAEAVSSVVRERAVCVAGGTTAFVLRGRARGQSQCGPFSVVRSGRLRITLPLSGRLSAAAYVQR